VETVIISSGERLNDDRFFNRKRKKTEKEGCAIAAETVYR